MFKGQGNDENFKKIETIIGPSVKVKGDFNGEGNIVVEGIFEGNLKTKANLLVGAQAKITADIEANEAKISGEINGNIKIAGYLDVGSTAKINGDIEASELSIERGALLNGNCAMSSNNKKKDKDLAAD